MEALKVLAAAVIFAVIFASVITSLVSLAIDPLERVRLRWLERGRQAEAAKAVRI